MSDEYEVFAIRYGERDGTRGGNLVFGDPHEAPMPMDYFVWAIRNEQRTVVVDLGFGCEDGVARGRTWLRCPSAGLAAIGIDAAQVEDVIVTHMHYDHIGNMEKFPKARFHLQDAEMSYATGRAMTHRVIRHSFTVDNVLDMVRMLYKDRVVFHNGDDNIAPGIDVHLIGGHTQGLQVVSVNTARGIVVLASDASHYYENMEGGAPFIIVNNMVDMLEGHRRLYHIAASRDHVVPGHDPKVMERYPALSDATKGVVVRLDVAPLQHRA